MQTHTFYIDKHRNGEEISLDGSWSFTFLDSAVESPESVNFEHFASIPSSAYKNLQQAGILPNPYYGLNYKLYEWADKKIWYYKKSFTLGDTSEKDVFLCFDGVGYYSRVWLNGRLICEHEGMFGGPVIEVGEFVHIGENELIVEVTPPAPDYMRNPARDKRALREIVPWNLRRDANTSNGDFIVFGIWRSVRIEILPKYHMSRPYLYTESINGEKATLKLEVEIADPQIKELDVVANDIGTWSRYTFAYADGIDLRPTGKTLDIAVKLVEKSTGNLAYYSHERVEIYDKAYICANKAFRECQFFEKTIEIQNPKLWFPNGHGNPELYEVTLELYDSRLIDRLVFSTGIRTVEYQYTAGMRHRTRWDKYHFIINGRPIFVKGMNWMPVDFLLDISLEDYRWALELAKNEGIQLLRIWSGGGMPEDDKFYELCDKLGIMVMQDNFIANQTTEEWDRQVLASQVSQNLYRIRNHPSLVIHTGGNEINPYALGNDAAMSVISREIADLDPSRKFLRTSPDKGSAHIYRDMEPVWYRKIYGQLPFIGESGIHSFPNAKSLRQQLSSDEYNRTLSNIFSDEFKVKNPELHNHFTEFDPNRIPRMMSRASMINNVRGITLPDLCEATQIASCEFYQIMINSCRENYPVCCGILPWVFKRAWTTVAIQLVDGLGDPIAPYYYVKNAYAPLSVELALKEVTYAPGESFTPEIKLICDDIRSYTGLTIKFELYSPALKLAHTESFECDISPDEYLKTFIPGEIKLPDEYTEKYFFLRAAVYNSSGLLNHSIYWCKVLERLADETFRAEYRAAPRNNIDFDKGPWLKPQLTGLTGGSAKLKLLSKKLYYYGNERRMHIKVSVSNTGSLPLFPVKLDIIEDKTLSYASDNYFFLPTDSEREIDIEVRIKDENLNICTLSLTMWNAEAIETQIELLT
jgi:beta-mannosidase